MANDALDEYWSAQIRANGPAIDIQTTTFAVTSSVALPADHFHTGRLILMEGGKEISHLRQITYYERERVAPNTESIEVKWEYYAPPPQFTTTPDNPVSLSQHGEHFLIHRTAAYLLEEAEIYDRSDREVLRAQAKLDMALEAGDPDFAIQEFPHARFRPPRYLWQIRDGSLYIYRWRDQYGFHHYP